MCNKRQQREREAAALQVLMRDFQGGAAGTLASAAASPEAVQCNLLVLFFRTPAITGRGAPQHGVFDDEMRLSILLETIWGEQHQLGNFGMRLEEALGRREQYRRYTQTTGGIL